MVYCFWHCELNLAQHDSVLMRQMFRVQKRQVPASLENI